MKFGIGPITAQIPPGDPRSDFAKYHEIIDMAEGAEEVGFDSIWLTEHHDEPDTHLTAELPMAAAVAQATNHITVGTGIAIAPFYHPLRLAEDAATIDIISKGRFVLGLGLGYRDRVFENFFQIPKSERVARTKDCVNICKRAWEGERFSYRGEVYEFEDVRVGPTPPRGSDLPIILGALAEPAVRRAARMTDGFTIVTLVFGEDIKSEVRKRIEWCEEEGVNRDRFTTMVLYDAMVADSAEEAWDMIEEGTDYALARYEDEFAESSEEMEFVGRQSARARSLLGTPAEVASQILDHADLYTPNDHFVVRLDYPGMDHEVCMEAIRRFGKEVIPRVRQEFARSRKDH